MSKKPQAGRSKKTARKKEVAKTQSERFIEAARAAGVDESGEQFDAALKRLVPSAKTKRR